MPQDYEGISLDGVRQGMSRINAAMRDEPAKAEYGIDARLNETTEALTDLDNAVADLIRRIDPLLSPSPAKEDVSYGGDDEAANRQSPLAEELASNVVRINELRRAVEYVIERLEI
jgi:hypothetical protein